MSQAITFFIDFDNTIINNDKVKDGINKGLSEKFGEDLADNFILFYNEIREELGHVDYLATIKKVSLNINGNEIEEELHRFFDSFDFASCLYEGSKNVIKHLKKFGNVVVVTEGEGHSQRIKIKHTGIWDLVSGQVEIPVKNKVNHILKIIPKYKADIYYVIDDKPEILQKIIIKNIESLKTIHICQGHYSPICKKEKFDLTVSEINKLTTVDFPLEKMH